MKCQWELHDNLVSKYTRVPGVVQGVVNLDLWHIVIPVIIAGRQIEYNFISSTIVSWITAV